MAKPDIKSKAAIMYARKANALFDALVVQGATYGERCELEAAGVAQHRIDALYPYNFADLIPAIQARIEPGFLDALDHDAQSWDSLTATVRYHMEQYSASVNEQARAAMDDLMTYNYEEYNGLWTLVRDCLPKTTENRAHGANSVLHALLHVCWLMNRTRRHTPGPLNYQRDYKLFIKVIQQTLPSLHASALAAAA